jgi:hypothetical protein
MYQLLWIDLIHYYQDDPIVEYEDEFGRMRTARRSEVPRNLQQTVDEEPEQEDEYVLPCLLYS